MEHIDLISSSLPTLRRVKCSRRIEIMCVSSAGTVWKRVNAANKQVPFPRRENCFQSRSEKDISICTCFILNTY